MVETDHEDSPIAGDMASGTRSRPPFECIALVFTFDLSDDGCE